MTVCLSVVHHQYVMHSLLFITVQSTSVSISIPSNTILTMQRGTACGNSIGFKTDVPVNNSIFWARPIALATPHRSYTHLSRQETLCQTLLLCDLVMRSSINLESKWNLSKWGNEYFLPQYKIEPKWLYALRDLFSLSGDPCRLEVHWERFLTHNAALENLVEKVFSPSLIRHFPLGK